MSQEAQINVKNYSKWRLKSGGKKEDVGVRRKEEGR